MKKSLKEIAERFGLSLLYPKSLSLETLGSTWIRRVASLEAAQQGDLSVFLSPGYRQGLRKTEATAVLMSPAHWEEYQRVEVALNPRWIVLAASDPRLVLSQLLDLLYPGAKDFTPPEEASRTIDQTAIIHPEATVGTGVVIGPDTRIESGVSVGPGCVIGARCFLGEGVRLLPRVVLYDGVTIGAHSVIHSGAVIGSDGFGYAQEKKADDEKRWVKIKHIGGVVIGSHVEIGANTTIDRGVLDHTVIESGVVIDNLVQIAHNVYIGENTAIAGCVAIAGSARIGKNCLIGGASNIAGHLEIADGSIVTGASSVNRTLPTGVYSSGIPAQKASEWRRNVARLQKMEQWVQRVKSLERQQSSH